MRVAYCIRALFPQHGYGGLERAGTELMEHMLASGVDITLFTRTLPRNEPLRFGEAAGRLTVLTAEYGRLPLRPNSIPARLTNYRSFVETLGRYVSGFARAGLIDAIYAHGLCAWGVRQASEWGVPLVVNPHGLEEFKTPDRLKRLAYAPFRAWIRGGARAADRVIATDSSMKDEVTRLLDLPSDKVVVLPNGVDLKKIASYRDDNVQAELAVRWPYLRRGEDSLRGISVGRLEENKGFEHLLRALGMVKSEVGAHWGWVIVGEGSLDHHFKKLTNELGLDDNVFFAGRATDDELHNLYELSNLFVHPTLFEGSSLVTMEAMAHSLPVLASATGGIPDKVADGVNGFLIAPGDAAALARRISWFSAHPDRRAEMGNESHKRVSKYDWEKIALATRRLLADMIEERASCRPAGVQPRTP